MSSDSVSEPGCCPRGQVLAAGAFMKSTVFRENAGGLQEAGRSSHRASPEGGRPVSPASISVVFCSFTSSFLPMRTQLLLRRSFPEGGEPPVGLDFSFAAIPTLPTPETTPLRAAGGGAERVAVFHSGKHIPAPRLGLSSRRSCCGSTGISGRI